MPTLFRAGVDASGEVVFPRAIGSPRVEFDTDHG